MEVSPYCPSPQHFEWRHVMPIVLCQSSYKIETHIVAHFYRNAIRSASRLRQPTPGTFSQPQPKTSMKPYSSSKPSTKSSSRSSHRHRSTSGTSKVDLLERLQQYIQRKFDGRVKELSIDNLQNYTVQNGKGSCHVKCPICDKLIKVQYGKYHGQGSCNPHWVLSHVTRHLNTHPF